MTIITNDKSIKVTIEELPNKKYSTTVEPCKGVSISRNGFNSIQECLKYAEDIKRTYEK